MKRFLLKISFWICLVYVFIVLVLFPLKPDFFADKKRLYIEQEQDSIGLLVLGSSRAEHTIIPSLLNTNQSVVNMGRDGHGLPSNYFLLKTLLEKEQKSIKTILFEFSEFKLNGTKGYSRKFRDDFFANDLDDEEVFEAFKHYRGEMFANTLKYFPKFNYLVYNDFRKILQAYPLVFKSYSNTIEKQYQRKIDTFASTSGYIPITTSNKIKKKNNVESYIIEDDDLHYFNKIVSLCEEYKIQLILFRAPVLYCDEYDSRQFDQFIKLFSKENNIPFYDYKCSFQFPENYFDNTHCTDSIAKLLTLDIKQKLKTRNVFYNQELKL